MYPAAIILTSMLGSVVSPVYAEQATPLLPALSEKARGFAGQEQTFVVTAYYSPLPDQCCYYRGNYEDEIIFNGNGTHGADGTVVYPGMIAAPETYPFGTVIELPGLGIGTVHDRGSRIVEWDGGLHRIDLWMGSGEEGLARALAWGTRTVVGTVYPVTSVERPEERWSLEKFDADPAVLTWLPKSDPTSSIARVSLGDRAYSVRLLQKTLKDLGFFTDAVTGTFGPVTQEALKKFLEEYGIEGDGSFVGDLASFALHEAQSIPENNLPEVRAGIEQGMQGSDVRQVQKLLRYLGEYKGRTDGIFDDDLKAAVLAFQLRSGVVGSLESQGAGRVGPATRSALRKAWKTKVVMLKAKRLVAKQEVARSIASSLPKKTLSKGDHGADVRALQSLLSKLAYLPSSDITGTFGDRTQAALLRYQLERDIVASEKDRGAGVFGPATKTQVLADAVEKSWQKVRSGAM